MCEVERTLRPFKQDEPGRAVRRDLTGKLRSDGASAARDEDRLAGDVTLHVGEIELDRLATEEVFDLDVPEVPDASPTGQQVLQ